ncbi:unnamed protein product [Ranitomeya imitator]|uniref:Microfibril associated protein 5 n=1 Tax=Ranitomeya imitator TaxID=111125 RepID=A0ABN9L3T4_9NEOB|nr:unnamed protein product [Ranitomeya imitator]
MVLPMSPGRRLLTDAFSQSVPWELAAVRRRWRIASTSILMHEVRELVVYKCIVGVAGYLFDLFPFFLVDCKEVKYPCTRVYSVQKPVKQCISYLCVTSVRRIYMINKEICTKIMCKEDEIMQEDKCRQLAGLPPRRLPEPQEPAEDETDGN